MIWIGLPAYNEAHRIKSLLKDIHNSLGNKGNTYKIVVYNDGSSDNTVAEVLSTANEGVNVQLIDNKDNKGLGRALSHLIGYCADASSLDDTVIIMDADATHNPEHINRMLGYIKDGFDVVIASRYTTYSRTRGLSLRRQFLSNTANRLFKLLFPIKGARDYTCSYRAYTAKILKLAKDIYADALIEEYGFACMAELLVKLRSLNIITCEVPLILRYDKKSGPTKMNVLSTIIKTLKVILKAWFSPGVARGRLEELKKKYRI